MEPTTEETTTPLQLVPNEPTITVDEVSGANAPVEHEVAPGVVIDGPAAVKVKSLEDQIRDLREQIEQLDAQRTKTVVEELALEPEALAAVAMLRRKERFPHAVKSVETHIKQLAWSGEREGFLEPTTPIFNDALIKHLKAEGFKAEIIKLGQNQGFKIKVSW